MTALVSFLLGLPLAAQAGAQQDKMTACNAEAKEKNLKGDERKKFMSECLSAKKKEETDKKTAQQEKMKTCNKDAQEKKLKGDERKKFMSECLKA
ncbi:MAG: phosphate starvation-inducible protein PsiF [Rhodocyclaceae bacterium]|nr:phosphate starvation-inducible protein PsiF [Rhodocyclaceae bacterium]